MFGTEKNEEHLSMSSMNAVKASKEYTALTPETDRLDGDKLSTIMFTVIFIVKLFWYCATLLEIKRERYVCRIKNTITMELFIMIVCKM
jgi:hypothetical protein